ncbi:hypothetical protein BH24ACT22_BH24ACT22_18130 [soil metagenome]
MAAYAVVLALLGATYASLVYIGPGIALAFALGALAAMLLALVLVIFK